MFGSNARENLNAKPRRNLRVRPIFCKSYGDAAKVYQEEEIPRAKLIWRAIKLPMYSVALVPLTVCFLKKPFYVLHCLYLLGNIHCSNVTQVGASAAYLETGLFLARRYVTLLLSSILIITWLNLRWLIDWFLLTFSLTVFTLSCIYSFQTWFYVCSNDVYDFDTGADKNKMESVVNLVGR